MNVSFCSLISKAASPVLSSPLWTLLRALLLRVGMRIRFSSATLVCQSAAESRGSAWHMLLMSGLEPASLEQDLEINPVGLIRLTGYRLSCWVLTLDQAVLRRDGPQYRAGPSGLWIATL